MKAERLLNKIEKPRGNWERWWYRVPVVLFCLIILASFVLFSRVATAASAPDLQYLLGTAVEGLQEFFDFLLEVLNIIW